jgi:hypothetical protein
MHVPRTEAASNLVMLKRRRQRRRLGQPANTGDSVCDDAAGGLIGSWRWYEGTAFGTVHAGLRKQARNIDPRRRQDTFELADTLAG